MTARRNKRAAFVVAALVVAGGAAGAYYAFRDGGSGVSAPLVETIRPYRLPPVERKPVASPLAPPDPVEIDAIRWPALSPQQAEAVREARSGLHAARAAHAAGRIVEGDQRMLAALDRLAKARVRSPDLHAFHYEALVSALDTGNHPELEKRALFWVRSQPGHPFALRLLMVASNALRRLDRAATAAGELLKQRPDDADALEILAIASYGMGRWEQAVEAAEGLCARRPGDVQAWRILCQAASELGAKDTGVAAARRLLALVGFPSPELWKRRDAELVVNAAMSVLHRFKAYEDLRGVAAFYRAKHPESLTAAMAEGVARLETGDPAGAEPLLRTALADPANAREVKLSLGIALAKQRGFREAARCFAELLLDDPFLERAVYQYGLCLARLGEPERAELFLELSESLGQSGRDIRRYRQYRGGGRLDEAVRSSAKGYRARGQYEEAESALLERGTERLPVAVITRVEFYLECLRIADARRWLAELEKLVDPASSDRAGNRARVLWASGARDEALALLRQLVRRSDCPPIWKHELAERLLESDFPSDQPLRSVQSGLAAEAVELIAPLRTDASHRIESWLLGRSRFQLGQYAEALELFESISRADLRWDEWLGSVWLARASVAADEEPARALKLLDELPPSQDRTRLALRARVEALARAGDAFSNEAANRTVALRAAEAADPAIEAARAKVVRATWPADGAAWLELAEALERGAERLEAIKFARVALHALGSRPESARAHERLVEWLDAPHEVFPRLRHLRALAKMRPGDAPLAERVKELESELVP